MSDSVDPREFERLRGQVDAQIARQQAKEEAFVEAVQNVTSIVQRVVADVKSVMQNLVNVTSKVETYVTDPDNGGWVRLRHLEKTVHVLDENVATALKELERLAGGHEKLDTRLHDLEETAREKAEKQKDTKRWLWRDVIIASILVVVTGLILALLTR